MPDRDQIAELRARADAGDRNAAGRLGELLAKHGDLEGAVRVWVSAYGDDSPTTARLAELMAGRGDLEGAVGVWRFSDVVRYNPAGLHEGFLSTLDAAERIDWEDEPEDWAFMETEQLARRLSS
ncbi:hypothetical protein ACQPZP_34090 [Spirillospora sp. CA-142024]|uniref:hypothetical protein n=1 Tax=Spirillospora sp. CA-142024 TaxID=3240036 RepID=UPI003D8AB7F3